MLAGMSTSTLSPAEIKALRLALGENTAAFAARFARSARTVENWEQGRRNPDPLAAAEMLRVRAGLTTKTPRKKSAKKSD
jgi:DNA-binding transcriptional regulator YiaG